MLVPPPAALLSMQQQKEQGLSVNEGLLLWLHGNTQGLLSHQYGRGQTILWEVTLQIRRQLQKQRTYFFPAGAFLIGCSGRQTQRKEIRRQKNSVDKKPIIPDSWKWSSSLWGKEKQHSQFRKEPALYTWMCCSTVTSQGYLFLQKRQELLFPEVFHLF